MSAVALGTSTFKRVLGQTPEVLLTNMYTEADSTNAVDGKVRLQRPGLVQHVNVADGPIRGLYQQAGTFDGRFLVVSGPQAALVTKTGTKTFISGTITGSARVSIAASATKALIATGGTLHSTDGVTISSIATPDDIGISSVTYINGYFIIPQTGTQRVYFMTPGAATIDALDFFSAENSADNVVRAERLGDELWLFGEASIEIWVPSGNADLPFERTSGRLYTKGCANRDTVAALDNTLFWVGNDNIVYRADNVPQRISDNGIEERLRLAEQSTLRAWAFSIDGHLFYVLTIGTQGTFAFDVSMQNWVRFQSYGRETWRAHLGTQSSGSLIIAGDDVTGVLWKLESGRSTDGDDPIIRELIGGVAVLGKPQICHNFSMFVNSGHVAPGLIPKIHLNYSDDGGNTWGPWDYMEVGETGDYAGEWTAWGLGMMQAPGRIFWIRMTDDCVFRISYARINEAFAA